MDPINLRELAKAIENYEAAKKYFDGLIAQGKPQNMGVNLHWSWGSTVEGSKELRDEMRALVEEQWEALARQALERLEYRKEVARMKVFK